MTVTITPDGYLRVRPESMLECYALTKWGEENTIGGDNGPRVLIENEPPKESQNER